MLRPGVYRNTGAGWTRPDGQRVERGDVFTPTAEERVRKSYKLLCLGPLDGDPLPQYINVEDYATGSGWYLVGGQRVRGRQAAEEALSATDE